MGYHITVNLSNIRTVPKKHIVFIVVLALFCVLMFDFLFFGFDKEKLQEETIHIDELFVIDTHDTRGSRIWLMINSEQCTYIAKYPQGSYRHYSELIEDKLRSGKISDVTVLVSSTNNLINFNKNRIPVYGIRTTEHVFYDIEDYLREYNQSQIAVMILLPICVTLWFCYGGFWLYTSHTIRFRRTH